jgi:hypothetical protein
MALIFVPKVLFIRKHAHDPREKEDDERETAEQGPMLYKTFLSVIEAFSLECLSNSLYYKHVTIVNDDSSIVSK